MRAWRINEVESMSLEDMESQPVGPNCVKIKILESAVTLTDILVYKGKVPVEYPIIPGRQCVGMVSEVGENVKKLQRGNRVVAMPDISCHECSACNAGRPSECQKILRFGYSEDGFLRDFAVLNANDLYLLPDRIKNGEALYLDSLDIAIGTIARLGLEKGQHIIIMGATDLGIILAQTAIYYQMVPILVDTDRARLEIAQGLGIYYTVNSVDQEPFKKIFTVTGGKMADGLAYITGSGLPFQQSFDYIKKGGGFAFVGDEDTGASLLGDFSVIFARQLNVTGISSDLKNVTAAINILANHSVNVLPLMQRSVSFEEAGDAIKNGDLSDAELKIIVKNG